MSGENSTISILKYDENQLSSTGSGALIATGLLRDGVAVSRDWIAANGFLIALDTPV